VEIVPALCHNLWLAFFCTATVIGIINGRGVLVSAKLAGATTVGEKGPWPMDKPRQSIVPSREKASLPYCTSIIRSFWQSTGGSERHLGVSKPLFSLLSHLKISTD